MLDYYSPQAYNRLKIKVVIRHSRRKGASMIKVVEANACYTGGGIYQYTGKLENGRFFQTWTDWEEYVQELDVNPEDFWDDNAYEEWQNEHLTAEYTGKVALQITKEAMEWIIENLPNGNYDAKEIEEALEELKCEYEIEKRTDRLGVDWWYIVRKSTGLDIHRCRTEEDAAYILSKFYRF